MSDLNNAWTIVENMMLANDSFSKMLGINIKELSLGACTLTMKVNESMTNGFSIGHGGITYSLADSALAFASNSHGRKAVSIETSISRVLFLEKMKIGYKNFIYVHHTKIIDQIKHT